MKTLLVLDDREAKFQDRRDGVALASAQRLLDAGRVDDARDSLAALAADPATAIRAHACLLYAGLLLMVARADDALAALSRIPAAPAFAVDEGYRSMIEACALRQARRYDDALVAAHAAVLRGPTSGRLLVLADAQKHAGHLDDASRTLRTLLQREPEHVTALAQLAGYRNLLGDLEEGAVLFSSFCELADDSADAKRNEAFYFATKNDVDGAVAALASALAVDHDVTLGYLDDEVELERFRGVACFDALRSR